VERVLMDLLAEIEPLFSNCAKDVLKKMIWAETDKWIFINTVTEPVLAKEKQVVKPKKDKDNRPYGNFSNF
jgi:hypothetical protein